MASTATLDHQDAPREIHPTLDELKASAYDNPNIEAALEALHQDGFVVLKSVVDVNHVKKLNSFMAKDAEHMIKIKPFNQGVNCELTRSFYATSTMNLQFKRTFFRRLLSKNPNCSTTMSSSILLSFNS